MDTHLYKFNWLWTCVWVWVCECGAVGYSSFCGVSGLWFLRFSVRLSLNTRQPSTGHKTFSRMRASVCECVGQSSAKTYRCICPGAGNGNLNGRPRTAIIFTQIGFLHLYESITNRSKIKRVFLGKDFLKKYFFFSFNYSGHLIPNNIS